MNFSNLNFIHKKGWFVSSFTISFIHRIIFSQLLSPLPNKYFPVLANLGWFLHLYSAAQTLITGCVPGLVPELRNQTFPAMISAVMELISYSSDNVLPPLFITWVTPLNFLYIFGSSHRLSSRYLFQNFFLSAKNSLTLTQFLGEVSYVCVIPHLPLGRAISLQLVKSEYQPLFPVLYVPW